MKSFEHDYYIHQPISQGLLMSVRSLGEFRGRQALYRDQFPEVLETLRRVAVVQSTESSNRIEGITVPVDRLDAIVTKKSKPKNRSEQEIAGYRDVLADIHANASKLKVSTSLILQWHRQLFRYTAEEGGIWKQEENAIFEILLGAITAAYKEFESRVGTITSARGAKREMVYAAIHRLPEEFSFSDIQRVCPGVSFATLKRALQDLKRKKQIVSLGKGRDARWKRIVSPSH